MAVPRAEFPFPFFVMTVPRAEFLRAIPLGLFRVQNLVAADVLHPPPSEY